MSASGGGIGASSSECMQQKVSMSEARVRLAVERAPCSSASWQSSEREPITLKHESRFLTAGPFLA
jgi:hypothetical protein